LSSLKARYSFSLSLEFAAIFWLIGLSLAYLPAWMQAHGLTSVQIGTILGLAFWGKIPLNLALAHVADRSRSQNRILLVMALAIVLLLPQMSRADGFAEMTLIWGICGAMLATSIPLSDSLCVIAWRNGHVDYGRTRLWGSGSFIAATVGGGWFLQTLGLDVLPTLMVSGAVLMVVASLTLPKPAGRQDTAHQPSALRRLLQGRQFRRFLLIAALLQSSHAMLYGFATIHWKAAGHSSTVIGLLWAEGVLVEIGLFAFAGNFSRLLSWRHLLLLAGAGGVVRWCGLAATTELAALVALQTLHGLTFACLHLGAMRFIAQHVAEQQTASAQSLYDGVALGFVSGIVMVLAGEAYLHWQGQAFLAMTVLSGSALLLLTVTREQRTQLR